METSLSFLKRSFVFWIFLVCIQNSKGQTESYIQYIDGLQIHMDSVLINYDDLFGNSGWSLIDTVYSSNGFIKFEIDPTLDTIIKDNYSCILTIEIKKWDSTNTIHIDTIILSVNYDSTLNVPYNNSSSWHFSDGYKIQAKILNVDFSQDNGSTVFIPLFRLYSQIDILRNFIFDCDTTPEFTIDSIDNERNQHCIGWSSIPGATRYDFEYTFVDDSSLISKNIALSSYPNLDSLFREDATRVSISENSYCIAQVYPSGNILYRVRALKDLTGFQLVHSAWNESNSNIFHVDWHEPDLSWQYTQTFAEEGKRKEIAGYMDGTLRNRQNVTLINTKIDSIYSTIVGETIYDFQGRPAVQAMPSPSFNGIIRYYDKYNLNQSGIPYNWNDFDTAGCAQLPGYMLSDSGASRYYSPNNPFVNKIPYKFIPDAGGYPFSISEYKPDLTGRLRRLSNVGSQLMLGSGHETRYFYGKPSQTELDRLFGNDVGVANHYTEELVLDPNGQGTVTYKDAHDRVIATALTGQPPHNLDTIPEYRPDTVITTDLKDVDHFEDTSRISSTSFLVKSAGTFTFRYSLFPNKLLLVNCDSDSICYDCYYNIHISISADCSPDPLANVPLRTIDYRNYQIPHDSISYFDTLCADSGLSVIDSFQIYLEVGSYNISRRISVSNDAIKYYADRFLEENTCYDLNHFIDLATRGIDSSGCNLTCETCMEQLGDTAYFLNRFFTAIDSSFVPLHEDTLNAYSLYHEAYENCIALCNPTNDCEMKKDLMESDLRPGGQYATYIEDPDGNKFPTGDRSSIFYIYNSTLYRYQDPSILPYVDEQNNPITVYTPNGTKSPDQLSLDEFIDLFDNSWLTTLMKLHPEYCYLQYCFENSASHDYDLNMLMTNTFSAALDSGFIDLTYSINDIYFTSLDGVTKLSTLQARMHNFKGIKFASACSTRAVSMWEYAAIGATEGKFPPGTDPCLASDSLNIFSLCEGDQNVA
jgi:hypothetical protein